MRHLKVLSIFIQKLPNHVITQENLINILGDKLEYLDLQYKTEISNDLINKIGYLAPNIKELNLASTNIDSNVIIELGKSCKSLEAIDISLCHKLEEEAILSFLRDNNRLKKFSANHLENAITDACLEALGNSEELQVLSINFCSQVTSAGI